MTSRDFDWKPLALVPLLALIVLPFIGSPSTWLTLTVAGLAMGMIIFIIASGLTLVFGLKDVLNFGHGVFIALGAFVATSVWKLRLFSSMVSTSCASHSGPVTVRSGSCGKTMSPSANASMRPVKRQSRRAARNSGLNCRRVPR